MSAKPVAWITDTESADMHGWISCKAWSEGEFTTPLVLATDFAALLAERDWLRGALADADAAIDVHAENLAALQIRAERLAAILQGAANYIDTLGGDSKAYRIQVTAIDAAISAMEGRECETCKGGGTVDMTLGGYSFSDPEAICPDCDGSGEAGFRKGPP